MHKLFSLIIVTTGDIANKKIAQGSMKYHSVRILLDSPLFATCSLCPEVIPNTGLSFKKPDGYKKEGTSLLASFIFFIKYYFHWLYLI